MSRTSKSWVLATLTSFIMVIGGLIFASPASAATPPQTDADFNKVDACETPDDQYEVKEYPDYDIADADGNGLASKVYWTGGANEVILKVYDKNTGTLVTDVHLLYPNNEACGTPAPNTYGSKAGTCDPLTGMTPWFAIFTNGDDAYNKPVKKVRVRSQRVADMYGPSGEDVEMNILDGTTKDIPLGRYDGGLVPGTYEFLFYMDDSTTPAKRLVDFVPACGSNGLPECDPALGAASCPYGYGAKPKGKLKQPKGTTNVRVKAINKKVTTRTKFVLTVNPQVGKTVKRTIWVLPNKVFKKIYAGKAGTKYKLKAMINGKLKRVAPVLRIHA